METTDAQAMSATHAAQQVVAEEEAQAMDEEQASPSDLSEAATTPAWDPTPQPKSTRSRLDDSIASTLKAIHFETPGAAPTTQVCAPPAAVCPSLSLCPSPIHSRRKAPPQKTAHAQWSFSHTTLRVLTA